KRSTRSSARRRRSRSWTSDAGTRTSRRPATRRSTTCSSARRVKPGRPPVPRSRREAAMSLNEAEQATAVRIQAGRAWLDGDLLLPAASRGVVLFAHGSGSSRHSSRNRYVAGELRRVGMGTLLMDLLTAEEEEADARTGHLRFDIGLLARRLLAATGWLRAEADTARLPVGYFGASTGGGAALVAAAEEPEGVRAVVSRGGRPDLAGDALPRVQAPTLLIVGGRDEPVIAMNENALARLRCEKRLEIVPGATHLFEEPGTLEHVASRAADWLGRHLTRAVPAG